MATIEITWTMGAVMTGWAATAVGLIRVYWRRSLEWDHAEKDHKLLLGDPDTLDPGLVRRVNTLESTLITEDRVKKIETKIDADGKLLTIIAKALNAYGPDDAAIVKAIEEKIHHIMATPTMSLEEDPFPQQKNTRKKADRDHG